MKYYIKCRNDKEELVKCQKKLFKLGYKWCSTGKSVSYFFECVESKFIILLLEDKTMTWSIPENINLEDFSPLQLKGLELE